MNVGIDEFAKAISDELTSYTDAVAEAVDRELDAVSKETQKKLKASSPGKNKKYAKGWRRQKGGDRLGPVYVIYNGKRGYLTHLLERGHAKANGRGRVEGTPHIEPAAEEAEQEAIRRIEEGIKNVNA